MIGETSALLLEAGDIEVELMHTHARRVVAVGQRGYGPFREDCDEDRDLTAEALEEVIDACIYLERRLRAIRRAMAVEGVP